MSPRGTGSGSTVAIAGAGIIGLSIAWRLAISGNEVTVFEKGSAAGEASWAGAGMLAPGGEVDSNSPLAQSAVEARRMYPSFVAELKAASEVPVDFQQRGGIDLAYSEAERIALEEKRIRQQQLDIHSKLLEAKQIATFWPRVRREGLQAGVFYPDDAIVDPRGVTKALVQACRKTGVVLREGVGVEKITPVEQGVAVIGAGQSANFDFVVIAAGAWSDAIDVSPLPVLPSVEPVKGVLLGYQQPDQTCSTIVRHGHTYLLQRESGLLIAGASVERAGFDRSIAQSVVEQLAARASLVFPHLGETTPTAIWSGFRPYSETVRFGAWHSRRLLLAYGHYRNGILLAPLTARQVAEQIARQISAS